jgi:hypothetical protein
MDGLHEANFDQFDREFAEVIKYIFIFIRSRVSLLGINCARIRTFSNSTESDKRAGAHKIIDAGSWLRQPAEYVDDRAAR